MKQPYFTLIVQAWRHFLSQEDEGVHRDGNAPDKTMSNDSPGLDEQVIVNAIEHLHAQVFDSPFGSPAVNKSRRRKLICRMNVLENSSSAIGNRL